MAGHEAETVAGSIGFQAFPVPRQRVERIVEVLRVGFGVDREHGLALLVQATGVVLVNRQFGTTLLIGDSFPSARTADCSSHAHRAVAVLELADTVDVGVVGETTNDGAQFAAHPPARQIAGQVIEYRVGRLGSSLHLSVL